MAPHTRPNREHITILTLRQIGRQAKMAPYAQQNRENITIFTLRQTGRQAKMAPRTSPNREHITNSYTPPNRQTGQNGALRSTK